MCFSIAFHMTSVWTRFKTRPNLRLRRWLVNVLLNGSLWKVCPCPCSVWAHSQNTNTPLFCSSTLQPKNYFFAMVICCLTRRTLAFSEVAMTVVPYSRYPRFFFFWAEFERQNCMRTKKNLAAGAKSQFTPPLHQWDMVICSFVLFLLPFVCASYDN